jgi:hypothetical protein
MAKSILQQSVDKAKYCVNNGRMQNLSGQCGGGGDFLQSQLWNYMGMYVCDQTTTAVLVTWLSIKSTYTKFIWS